jgi:hypothetical protein
MTEKPKTIITRFVPYSLYLEKPEDAAAYQAIVADRVAAGIKMMEMLGSDQRLDIGPSRDVVLELTSIFGDQWNTSPDQWSEIGYRMHNWYQEARPHSPKSKIGHYLIITDEMREVCRLTHKCGYCGAQYWGLEWAGKFCDKCLDRAYLKSEDLRLLRLTPVSIHGAAEHYPPLTDAELAYLMPRYIERQTAAKAQAMQMKRAAILADYEKVSRDAVTERDGFFWLLDHEISVENVIYYKHTGKFSFGWRSVLSAEVQEVMKVKLADFPFPYEFAKK